MSRSSLIHEFGMSTMKTIRVLLLLALSWLTLPASVSAFYNPSTGRWLNRDPLGETGFEKLRKRRASRLGDGPNPYHFTRNNAVARFDRLGLAHGNPVPPVVSLPVSRLNCPPQCGPDITASANDEFSNLKRYLDNAPEMPITMEPGAWSANHAFLVGWLIQTVKINHKVVYERTR